VVVVVRAEAPRPVEGPQGGGDLRVPRLRRQVARQLNPSLSVRGEGIDHAGPLGESNARTRREKFGAIRRFEQPPTEPDPVGKGELHVRVEEGTRRREVGLYDVGEPLGLPPEPQPRTSGPEAIVGAAGPPQVGIRLHEAAHAEGIAGPHRTPRFTRRLGDCRERPRTQPDEQHGESQGRVSQDGSKRHRGVSPVTKTK
jgi:hypothetical protein